MLANKNRFHGHGSLRYVYRNGKAVRRQVMTLKFTTNPRRTTPRVSVVVGKKVYKGAVGRNRIRRRVYELIRHQLADIVPSCDLVFIITSAEVRVMPPDELQKTINQLLSEANLYKSTPEADIL